MVTDFHRLKSGCRASARNLPLGLGDADGGQPDALLAPLKRGQYHLSPQDAAENPAVSRRCERLDASVGINGRNRRQNQPPQNPRKLSALRADVNGMAAHETPCLYPVLLSNGQKGVRVSRCRSGREGQPPRTVPQRRNLSSSKPRILSVFAAANLFAATILRCGNEILKLLCFLVIFIISNKCTGVKFYLWDAFIYIHFPAHCGLPVSAEKKNAVCQLCPQRPYTAF